MNQNPVLRDYVDAAFQYGVQDLAQGQLRIPVRYTIRSDDAHWIVTWTFEDNTTQDVVVDR